MPTPLPQDIHYTLSYQDVVEVLRIVRESPSCASIQLEIGGMRLDVQRAGSAVAAAAAAPSVATASAPATVTPAPAAAAAAGPVAAPAADAPAKPAAPAVTIDPGLTPVNAPMLGIFYHCPSPGAAPFVKEGDTVKPDDTIGLIEVMKLFSNVSAGVAGRIVKVVAENAALVEHGQPLILIDTSKA